jgi:hypothetical protein
LESNHEIKFYKINGFKTEHLEARLYISKKYFGDILYEKYGLIPNRFDTSKLKSNIPKEYMRDFIRGVFDAEGSIISKDISYKTCDRKEFSISVSTYEEVLNIINDELILNNLTKTKYKMNHRHPERDSYCRNIRITGNEIVLSILNWLYLDSNINMESKYNKYNNIKEYMKNYHVNTKGEL